LSHKQTELCICWNVVLYINSASYIAEMVLQCAIQMSDIRKTLKNCQMKIAYLLYLYKSNPHVNINFC
jgi:hypothetical protein